MEAFFIFAIITFHPVNGVAEIQRDFGATRIVGGSSIEVCNKELPKELARILQLPEIRVLKKATVHVECRPFVQQS